MSMSRMSLCQRSEKQFESCQLFFLSKPMDPGLGLASHLEGPGWKWPAKMRAVDSIALS